MNIAVLISGNGSNLQALIDAQKTGKFADSSIKLVISNTSEAYGLNRAEKEGIRTVVIDHKAFDGRESFDRAIIEELEKNDIGLVVLAGFMRMLSEYFVKTYENKMINIHPALLPSFKGVHGIQDAYNYGVKVTGVTVHFVTPDMDAGPVILQEALNIGEGETVESLEERIHKVEHRLYPEAVELFAKGNLKVENNKVKILNKK